MEDNREIEISRLNEFERFLVWKMNGVREPFFTANDIDGDEKIRLRIFSENDNNNQFNASDVVTSILQHGENFHFDVHEFYDQNGINYGKITYWVNPNFTISALNATFDPKFIGVVEINFSTDLEIDFAVLI